MEKQINIQDNNINSNENNSEPNPMLTVQTAPPLTALRFNKKLQHKTQVDEE